MWGNSYKRIIHHYTSDSRGNIFSFFKTSGAIPPKIPGHDWNNRYNRYILT